VRVVQADAGFSNFVRMVDDAATINGKGEGVTTKERRVNILEQVQVPRRRAVGFQVGF
jgi:hypothetical protein